ncbi:MAG: hypothetical protein ROM54_06905 [Anaerobiospirillum sp.]|nr:hypothetical protein [Anaerobiospirillum sp.]
MDTTATTLQEALQNALQDLKPDAPQYPLGVMSAAPFPELTLLQAAVLPQAGSSQAEAELAAQRRKAQKLKCQGHATQGAAARYYPVPAGREAVPQPSAAEREKIFSFTPPNASQVNRLIKCMRSERVQETTNDQGEVVCITLKPATREEALNLSLQIEALKSNKRDDFVDQLLLYFMAPTGLGREDHQRTRALLERLAPRHILDLARNYTQPVWQDFIAEANEAWTDPVQAQLTLYEGEIPARPKVKDANVFVTRLSERSALLPEPFRLALKDLIRILRDCQPSKLHDFMELLQGLFLLSSRDLILALIDLGQKRSADSGLDSWINPKAYEAVGGDVHKRLQALMSVAKPKKAAAKKAAGKKTAKTAKTAQPAGQQETLKQSASAKRTAAQASASAQSASVQASAAPTPTAAESAAAEPTAAEPTVAEPTAAEPTVAESAVAEPIVAEPTAAELSHEAEVTAPSAQPATEAAASSSAAPVCPEAATLEAAAAQEAAAPTAPVGEPGVMAAQEPVLNSTAESESLAAPAPEGCAVAPAALAESPVTAPVVTAKPQTAGGVDATAPEAGSDGAGGRATPNVRCKVAVDFSEVEGGAEIPQQAHALVKAFAQDEAQLA